MMIDETFIASLHADLAQAEKQANRARAPFDIAIGDLLREARPQLTDAEFGPWLQRHFRLSLKQANRYIALSEEFDAFRKGGA
jgi:hypothetical protein